MKHLLKLSIIVCLGFLLFPDVSYAGCSVTYGNYTMSSNGYMVTGVLRFPGYERGGNKYDIVLNTYGDSRNNSRYTVYNTCWTETQVNNAAGWAFWTFVDEFFAQSNNVWTHNPGCGNTHTFTRTLIAQPVNGVCGTARNTCSMGTSGTANESSTSYTWSCDGSSGGTTAQCSLDKDGGRNGGGGGGGGNGGNPSPSPEIPQPVNFDPFCTAIPNYAAADGDDAIAWTVRDRAGRSFSGYNFAWTYTGPQGVDFNASNEEAVLMTSNTPMKINLGQVSVRVYGGTIDKTAQCPSATFGKDIVVTFSKPIVEPGESCRLNWSGIDVLELPTCKIYDQTNTAIYDIVEFPSGFRDVLPNPKYYIKCESAPDPENPDAERGVIQSEFLQCIRRGDLIEI